MLSPHKENICFCKKYLAVRVPHPSFPVAVIPSGRLHLGHLAADALAHLAQNMVFQHNMGPEIAPVQRKVVFSIIRRWLRCVGCAKHGTL